MSPTGGVNSAKIMYFSCLTPLCLLIIPLNHMLPRLHALQCITFKKPFVLNDFLAMLYAPIIAAQQLLQQGAKRLNHSNAGHPSVLLRAGSGPSIAVSS
jgi:hypothetical protein